MTGSYRVWSAVMGAWYLLGLASLAVYHPGAQQNVTGTHGRVVVVPQHRTYFEDAGGWELTVTVIGIGALALIFCAVFRWQWLRSTHLAMMVVVYAFGIGYFASAIASQSPWSLAGFALAAAAGHILFARLGEAAIVVDTLAGRS